MERLYVVFGLHLYQPPTQRPEKLKEIFRECYEPLFETIASHTHPKLTIDIAQSLLELLLEHHLKSIKLLSGLVTSKKIFLANTATYHPILPLIPEDMAGEQLLLNEVAYCNLLGMESDEPCSGVFPPEMAYSPSLIPLLRRYGYRWIVTDDLPYAWKYNQNPPVDWIPQQDGITIFLRSRLWSNKISMDVPNGRLFAESLWKDFGNYCHPREQTYLILWMDGETFGHHHKDAFRRFLDPFLKSCKDLPIELTSAERILELFPKKAAEIPPGSWSCSEEDLTRNIPYPLWRHPDNQWHRKWWKLVSLVIDIAREHKELMPICHKTIYSCQPWWHSVYRSTALFEWAIPYFDSILKYGTPKQQTAGKRLIRQLQLLV